MAKNNIAWFARYYLSEHVRTEIGSLHKEWIKIMTTYEKVALACPREHAKSTWWSLVYVLYSILFQKRKFIVLVSDTATQAEEFLGSIIEELETNEKIIRDFGKLAGYIPPKSEEKEKWTAKDIVTTTKVKVVARGWKSKLRGLKKGADRPDLIILDDVENDENVESEDQRKKVMNMFNKSIMNLGSIGTQVIVVGTILHFDSLLNNLINNPRKGWFTRLYKAIENNRPLWPEWWSMERLDAKREDIGSIAFEQEFMNNPLDPTQQILFLSSWFESIDPTMCDKFAYLDLASKEKQQNDWTAIVSIYRNKATGKLYTVDPQRIKGKMSELLVFLFSYYQKHKHNIIGIESNNFQTWFAQAVLEKSTKEQIYLPFLEIEQIKDKVTRAKSVSVYTENGTVSFNNAYLEFNAEVQQFPKGSHDDWVDSLVEGIKLAIQNQGSNDTIVTGRGVQYPKT